MENPKHDILNTLSWYFTFLAISGSILNIYKLWWSFAVWSICNLYFIIHNTVRKERALTCLFSVYLVISLWGMVKWLCLL
jgi:hypothetical protein